MSEFLKMPNMISLKSLYTFITKRAESEFYFAGESHPFWEMVCVMEGTVGVAADDRIYKLGAGDIIFHKPMEFHRIWAEEGTCPYYVVLSFEADGDDIKELENRVVKGDEYTKSLMEQAVELRKVCFDIKNEMVVNKILDKQKAFECVKKLELFICHAMDFTSFIQATDDRDALLFGSAVTLLRKNIGKKMTVDEIAAKCFVSASKIKKVFSKYVSCGVMEYFTALKMTEARKKLAYGKSVSFVSEYLGYSNQFYFSTVFKKETGMTPSEFRKKLKK